ncbi:methyltransferase domain-containing protein [Bacillus mangrovi]|uniref:Methyltransferase domain-containing protein n=1 Tax=Metabacillus mangrovi TaxID=1491830 RepID=A0A7X2S810_9BACI|nr:class I SAM-dependent methyltransferase [Metabacillus mangrovi]MTH54970.1 methyltransferase domain-containing protein [Metabacillus mangrovi]
MKEVIHVFNQLAEIYEHSIDSASLFNSEYERPAMLECLPEDLSGLNIFDAGCAAGWYTVKLAQRGAKVTAADISPEMVQAAKRRTGHLAEVHCLNLAGALPFEDQSFDQIVSSLTLHYLEDWSATFKEFNRVLKPGGKLLFSFHHPFTDVQLLQEPLYFQTDRIVDQWKKEGRTFAVPFYRRPLEKILNETLSCFSIKEVVEPKPTERFKEQNPERYEELLRAPVFLIINAEKHRD